jgi:hypothetical protein
LRSAAFGHERAEVAPSVVHEHDGLAVDERPLHRQTANLLGDRREPIREVRATAAPDLRALAQLADKNPKTIMLYLMQPAVSGERTVDERGLARADETDRRDSTPTRRRGAP